MVTVPEGYAIPKEAKLYMLQSSYRFYVYKIDRGPVRRRVANGGVYTREDFIRRIAGHVVKSEDGEIRFRMEESPSEWANAESVQSAIIAICTIHRMKGGG